MSNIDLLLINPGKVSPGYMTEHLGIAGLVSYARSLGFNADSLDMAIERISVGQAVQAIMGRQPGILGVSMLDDSKHLGLALIKSLRISGFTGKIVVGGYFPTFASRELLEDFPEIDYVVRGEGEITLGELLQQVLRNEARPLSHIMGLSFREDGKIIENPDRPLIQDLDILPPVDRKYSKEVLNKGSRLRVSGTRGCWGNCSFCDIIALYGRSHGKAWRSRSISAIVDELEYLKRKYETDYFVFNDDQFLLPGNKAEQRIDEFVDELQKRGLAIQFEMMCRADTVTKSGMTKLKSVGLKAVFLGLESFDEGQLQRFRKKISVRQNLKALITLFQLKIDVVASVILADAHTTLRDIIRQFVILYELKRRYFNSSGCQISINPKIEIYRGSAVYNEYRLKNLLKNDHYLDTCTYRLKFWTAVRLSLLQMEVTIGRIILHPVRFLKQDVLEAGWFLLKSKFSGYVKNYQLS